MWCRTCKRQLICCEQGSAQSICGGITCGASLSCGPGGPPPAPAAPSSGPAASQSWQGQAPAPGGRPKQMLACDPCRAVPPPAEPSHAPCTAQGKQQGGLFRRMATSMVGDIGGCSQREVLVLQSAACIQHPAGYHCDTWRVESAIDIPLLISASSAPKSPFRVELGALHGVV